MALMAFVASLVVCCTKNSAIETEQSFKIIENITLVKTANISIKSFDYFIFSYGKIKPVRDQKIIAQLEGKVKTFAIHNGLHVKHGQILLTFSTEASEIRFQRSEANLYKTRLEFKSQMMGYNSSGRNLEDSIVQLLRASSGLTQAELDLKEIKLELEKAFIYAPFEGRIANLKIQEGWLVKPGDELFTVYSDTNLYVEVNVLETDISLIKINYLAEVIPISIPNKVYPAKVIEINPQVNESGIVAVKLKLLNTEGLLPGMNANASIRISDYKTLVIPREAVVLRNGKTVVFTLENGLAKWNYVTTGRENGSEIEIKGGLKPDQKIIIANNLQLAHDTPVQEENIKLTVDKIRN